jgi:hypothetical protein
MMFDLNCAIHMRVLLRLSLHIRILIIGNIKLFFRNLVNPKMTAALDLNPLSVAYVLVVLLLILIMNVLNNYFMLLIIMFGV